MKVHHSFFNPTMGISKSAVAASCRVPTIDASFCRKSSAVPPAFSEASLASLHREGLVDGEGYKILKSVGAIPDRLQVYDRSQPMPLLRIPGLSASVELPPIETVKRVRCAEGSCTSH